MQKPKRDNVGDSQSFSFILCPERFLGMKGLYFGGLIGSHKVPSESQKLFLIEQLFYFYFLFFLITSLWGTDLSNKKKKMLWRTSV